eukprot:5659211-Amphidinium_carterae.1
MHYTCEFTKKIERILCLEHPWALSWIWLSSWQAIVGGGVPGLDSKVQSLEKTLGEERRKNIEQAALAACGFYSNAGSA